MKWLWRIFAVLAVPALGGFAYQQWAVSRDLERFPPPGKSFDVGDHKLHLQCQGEGSPTVLLEASGLGNVLSYAEVLPHLAPHVRACAYDRAGMGWSERLPRGLTSSELADDLHKLTQAAKLEPPFVLAGASIGGLTIEMYARRWPAEVKGLVFLDGVDSESLADVGAELASMRIQACIGARLASIGLMRAIDPFHISGAPAALTYRSDTFDAVCSLLRHLPESDRELAATAPLAPDVPLLVLSHEQPSGLLLPGQEAKAKAMEPTWQRMQRTLAARSTRGEQWTIAKSGHLVAEDSPRAVAQAILDLVERLQEVPAP